MNISLSMLASLTFCLLPTASGASNLVGNGGLETLNGQKLPASWEPLIIGAEARFSVDEQTMHSGQRAIRIDAPEVTRSYLRSAGIPVAGGEVVEISAWVKVRDVPAGQGTVILIAEFARGTGKGSVGKVGTANVASGEWQRIHGRVTVPPTYDTLRVRMGLSYSRGTAWWDDVQVRAGEGLIARVDAAENRIYPAAQALPVAVVNRKGRQGPVRIVAKVGEKEFARVVELSGEPVQAVAVPGQLGRRGKIPCMLRIEEPAGGKVIWASGPDSVTVPPALTLLPPSPTHWVIEHGPPRLRLEMELALDGEIAEGSRAVVKILDEASAVVFARELDVKAPSGLAVHDLAPPPLPAGRYRMVASVTSSAEASPITAEQPWGIISRSAASVHLNSDGYLVKNGKAVLPLGMFNNEARLKEEVEAGFNIVHFYNAARVHAGLRPDDQRLADAMNRCHAAGMHVLLMVPQGFAEEGEWEAFTRRIRMFRNHPALLAWDEEEGLARGDMKMETLRRIRQILREEDPHHPLMVGDARDVIGRIDDRGEMFPAEQMDLGMWWWYPLPLRETASDALEGEEASNGLLLEPPTFLTRNKTGKPVWVGVQAYKKPGPQGRYPTPTEYRAQAYLALIHGAKGLMWYGGSVTGGTFLNPKEASWDAIKQLVSELAGLTPVLMGRTAPPPEMLPADAAVDAAIRESGSRRVLMAVNRGPAGVQVSFTLPAVVAGRVRVIGENRDVKVEGGRLTDRFDPYSTHVYELGSGGE